MASKRIHASLPEPISEGLEALATIEKRTVSDILAELSRAYLKENGYLTNATPGEVAAAVEKLRRSKRSR